MTLHDTTELIKKAGIGSVIGIIGIIVIVFIIRIGIMLKSTYLPEKTIPPTQTFGLLPAIAFPKNVTAGNFTYTLQTTSGDLPTGLPDRLSVFPVIQSAPNFLNLEKVKQKVASLAFTSSSGITVPEIQLTQPFYEWDEQKDFYRKIIFNINSFDFKMTSDYLQYSSVASGQFISNELNAATKAQEFLASITLFPKDVDLSKTTTPNNPAKYETYPKLYSLQPDQSGSNVLVETTSLSKTDVIRVDLYQKDVEYNMVSGVPDESNPTVKIKLPILYPQPPFSTMSFWIASGPSSAMVTQVYFTHQNINLQDPSATYFIKTPTEAFEDLKNGKSYIAAYYSTDNNILIKNVYLGYYMGEQAQQFIMPIYVFEGNNGFFAYVSAIRETQIQK